MTAAAMPAPTQHPMHLASAGFGGARVAAAIPAAATMAVMVLGMAFSMMQRSPHPYDHTNNALSVKPVPAAAAAAAGAWGTRRARPYSATAHQGRQMFLRCP